MSLKIFDFSVNIFSFRKNLENFRDFFSKSIFQNFKINIFNDIFLNLIYSSSAFECIRSQPQRTKTTTLARGNVSERTSEKLGQKPGQATEPVTEVKESGDRLCRKARKCTSTWSSMSLTKNHKGHFHVETLWALNFIFNSCF